MGEPSPRPSPRGGPRGQSGRGGVRRPHAGPLPAADHAATAIRNARLYHAEQNQREFAEALAQAAASISSSLELDKVLDHILEQTMRVIPCQAVNIMTIEGNQTSITRHRGYENYLDDTGSMQTLEPDISWPILQELYQEENPVLI